MIEIDLLPEELKAKSKKSYADLKDLTYLVPFLSGALVVLMLGINLSLLAVNITKKFQLFLTNNNWKRLASERQTAEELRKKYDFLFSVEGKIIQKLINQRINWSEKLNKLSLNLPSGVWFNDLSVNQKNFVLKCSAVSLQKEEMALIGKFIDNLKKDPGFFKDFASLELSSVQRKTIGGYDVVDFVLLGVLK